MVIRGEAKPGNKEKGLVIISPKTREEFEAIKYETFVIKFSTTTCPPCRRFHSWLETEYNPGNKTVPVVSIVLDSPEQSNVSKYLRQMFEFNSIPYIVFTNKNFINIRDFAGFDSDLFIRHVNEIF